MVLSHCQLDKTSRAALSSSVRALPLYCCDKLFPYILGAVFMPQLVYWRTQCFDRVKLLHCSALIDVFWWIGTPNYFYIHLPHLKLWPPLTSFIETLYKRHKIWKNIIGPLWILNFFFNCLENIKLCEYISVTAIVDRPLL